MEEKYKAGIGNRQNTTTIHIGNKRYKDVASIAIAISVEVKEQVAPSAFVKYMIDNFSEQAKDKLLLENGIPPAT